MELFHLHPVVVHFPIALLTLGLAAEAASLAGWRREKLAEAASWLLWLGTLGLLAALGSGFLAEETAPHVPAAWEVLDEHETLAWITAGVFAALSLWRGFRGLRWRRAALAAWLAGAGLLAATGWHGGELVFRFGMGVLSR